MKKIIDKNAYNMGYNAAKAGNMRAPAMNPKFCAYMSNNTLVKLDSYLVGFDKFNDEQAAKIFPNDPYFQQKLTKNV